MELGARALDAVEAPPLVCLKVRYVERSLPTRNLEREDLLPGEASPVRLRMSLLFAHGAALQLPWS
jgi:hypothetical protein